VPADTLVTALGYRRFLKETRPNEIRMKSTTYAAPFSGSSPSPIYHVPERTTGKWSILSDKATISGQDAGHDLSAGITYILPDSGDANTVFLCNVHGIFKSTDLGKTYRLVHGSAVRK